MRLPALSIAIPLLCAGLWTAEADGPTASCIIPDLQGLVARTRAHPGLAAMAGLGATDAAWSAVSGRAGQARLQWDVRPAHGGSLTWRATAALLAPEAAELQPGPGLRSQRAGAWWLVGHAPGALELPAPPVLQCFNRPGSVLSLAGRLQHLPRLLTGDEAEGWNRLLADWHADRVELVIDADGPKLTDRAAAPGAILPVRSIAGEALNGVPADALAVAAIGIDGAAAAKGVRLLAAVMSLDIEGLESRTAAWSGLALERIIESIDGTLCVSLHGDPAAPDVLLSLPANDALDQLLARWIAVDQPEQAAALIEAAREQAVPLALPGLPASFVRRTAGRLWLSTSARLLNISAVEPLTPFPVAATWPGIDGACLAARWSDGALRTRGAALPAGWLVVRQDQHGLTSAGEGAWSSIVPLIAAMPAWLPPLARQHALDCDRITTANMHDLLACALSFSKQTSGHWPRDLGDLRAWARNLGPERFACAGRPDLADPFCFVPPLVEPPAEQPVLVQDPAANDGRGSLVGFADGRVEFRAGLLFWQEAKRLAEVARKRDVSVDIGEWATTPKTF